MSELSTHLKWRKVRPIMGDDFTSRYILSVSYVFGDVFWGKGSGDSAVLSQCAFILPVSSHLLMGKPKSVESPMPSDFLPFFFSEKSWSPSRSNHSWEILLHFFTVCGFFPFANQFGSPYFTPKIILSGHVKWTLVLEVTLFKSCLTFLTNCSDYCPSCGDNWPDAIPLIFLLDKNMNQKGRGNRW